MTDPISSPPKELTAKPDETPAQKKTRLAALMDYWWNDQYTDSSPMERQSADWWREQFAPLGTFVADVVTHPTTKERKYFVEADMNVFTPPILYRAARFSTRNRWSWSDDINALEVFALYNSAPVWQCTKPKQLFGVIGGHDADGGYFREWVIEPGEVTPLPEATIREMGHATLIDAMKDPSMSAPRECELDYLVLCYQVQYYIDQEELLALRTPNARKLARMLAEAKTDMEAKWSRSAPLKKFSTVRTHSSDRSRRSPQLHFPNRLA